MAFTKPILPSFLIGMVVLLLATPVHGADIFQDVFGNVYFIGKEEANFVKITQDLLNDDLVLIVSDDTNTVPQFHNFSDVRSLNILSGGGNDLVSVSGDVSIDHTLYIDLGDGSDQFFREGNAHLSVRYDFWLLLGTGFNEIMYDGSSSSVDVGGSLQIDAEQDSSNIMSIGWWFVGKNLEFELGKGINSLFMPSNINSVAFDVGGDADLDFGGGDQAKFIHLGTTSIDGDLTISTGHGDDEVTFGQSSVYGRTYIQTFNGEDTFNTSSSKFNILEVITGRHSDRVRFIRSTAGSFRLRTNGGPDLIEFENSEIVFSTIVDGGIGNDTGNQTGMQYGMPPAVYRVENGNL